MRVWRGDTDESRGSYIDSPYTQWVLSIGADNKGTLDAQSCFSAQNSNCLVLGYSELRQWRSVLYRSPSWVCDCAPHYWYKIIGHQAGGRFGYLYFRG